MITIKNIIFHPKIRLKKHILVAKIYQNFVVRRHKMGEKYNDYIEKFDAKSFEKLAKEYSKKYPQNDKVFGLNFTQKEEDFAQKTEQNLELFLTKYEALLDILFECNMGSFCVQKSNKILTKKCSQNVLPTDLIKSYCKLYLELKGSEYFCPIFWGKGRQNADKIFASIKELLMTDFSFLDAKKREKLIELILLTIKYIHLGYHR